MTPSSEARAAEFAALRPLLFTVAYEITGSVADSDDILQDAYLRWADVDPATVRNTKSYLAQVVTRQSLNHLRSVGRRREDYVGPWLPEPLVVDDDASADVLLAESVSTAMLVVLETLSPAERAIFVLREVFAFTHEEIADAVGKSPTAVRQAARRAKAHVAARRKRFEPADTTASEVAAALMLAAVTGDVRAVMDTLAPDVVLISDGGGKASAARRPVIGADRVARFFAGLARKGAGPATSVVPRVVNGSPAFVVDVDGDGVIDLVVVADVVDGKVTELFLHRNPDKLAGVGAIHTIGR